MDSLGRQKGKNQKGPVAANPGACLYRNPLPKLASSAGCMPVSGSPAGQGREDPGWALLSIPGHNWEYQYWLSGHFCAKCHAQHRAYLHSN